MIHLVKNKRKLIKKTSILYILTACFLFAFSSFVGATELPENFDETIDSEVVNTETITEANEQTEEQTIHTDDNKTYTDTNKDGEITIDDFPKDEQKYYSITNKEKQRSKYIFDTRDSEFNIDEYRTYREAQPATRLTDMQIAQGWVLINGYAYPPNDVEGELGNIVRGDEKFNEDGPVGTAHIVANVDPGTKLDAFIEIMDPLTYDTYTINLYAASHYTEDLVMPVGVYAIVRGGLEDSETKQIASVSNFEIFEGEISSVIVNITSFERALREGAGEDFEHDNMEDNLTTHENVVNNSISFNNIENNEIEPIDTKQENIHQYEWNTTNGKLEKEKETDMTPIIVLTILLIILVVSFCVIMYKILMRDKDVDNRE